VIDSARLYSGGPQTWDEPSFTVKGSNITPDPEAGIGKWSISDTKRAIVEGVRPSVWGQEVRHSAGPGASRYRATSPSIRRKGSAPGAMPRSSAPSRKASVKTAAGSSPHGFDWYARMNDDDLSAIVAYLRTVPPKE